MFGDLNEPALKPNITNPMSNNLCPIASQVVFFYSKSDSVPDAKQSIS